MVYSSQNAAFLRDKQQFFSQHVSGVKPDINAINQRVEQIGYSFLLQNHQSLEAEFTQMFASLEKKDDANKEVFWFYSYYCASLLELFYQSYSQANMVAKYSKIKQQIKDRLEGNQRHSEEEVSFIASLKKSFADGFKNLISSPLHISQARDYVAYTNLCRLYWTFCRLTMTSGFAAAKELHLIDKLDALLGTHTDVDKIISTIQAPTYVINYFSVGFFLFRIMVDGGLLLRHTFFPSELEKGLENSREVHKKQALPGAASLEAYRNSYIWVQKDESEPMQLFYIPKKGNALKLEIKNGSTLQSALLKKFDKKQFVRLSSQEIKDTITAETGHVPEVTTAYDRFLYEISKRHGNFANDFVWATVNFMSNFSHIVGISSAAAGYLTSVFLVFDVAVLLYLREVEKVKYFTKRAQYLQEIDDYQNPKLFIHLTAEQKLKHVGMLNQQMIELDINWRTKEATLSFAAVAAVLLFIGFTGALIANPAVMVAVCFFVGTIAVAMYLSGGVYSKYKEKSLYLEHAVLTGKNELVAQKEYEIARNDFIFTMIKNTVMPTLLISTFAICWPAAVALTVVYLAYELYHAYDQNSESKAVKQLALADSREEADIDAMVSATP